jgi:monoamine oxidase
MTHEISRRDFIHLAAKTGGASAAYSSMIAMGLLPAPAAYAGPPLLPPGSGTGVNVVILGAGIAGMTAAYELRKADYTCRIFEARSRPGGRNWSLRQGDVVEERDTWQTVSWGPDDHLYFNPGPARIPHHHQGILSYCRELEVPIEVIINDNRAAYFHDDKAFDGKPQLAGSIIGDSRGFVAELAAKAVAQPLLDQPISMLDRKRVLEFLTAFGDLEEHFMAYRGSSRGGYATPPGACAQEGVISKPIDLWQLLSSNFWERPKGARMFFGETFQQAATMLQPIGGMGRIGEAFGRKLAAVIQYDSEVTAIEKTPKGVKVRWRSTKPGGSAETGEPPSIEADYLICTIPFSVLRNIESDFSKEIRAGIASVDYTPAGKIAFEAERRFWELDHQIYGGISWTSRDITQIWYPSTGFHRTKGILVGAYIWDKAPGEAFAAKSLEKRITDAITDGEALHPNYGRSLGKGVSVAWPNIPFTRGAWATWDSEVRTQYYPALLKGDHNGRILFAGEHMSYLNGWQEGAVLSAHCVIDQIAKHLQESRP